MGDGCTSCGNKGGCDHRKGGMFAAIDEALTRLYPSRRWGERDDGAASELTASALAPALATRIAKVLGTEAVVVPGGFEACCDFLYVLCFGRSPSVLAAREGAASAREAWNEAGGAAVEERHLRVALSAVAPFVVVQEVALRMESLGDEGWLVEEAPRSGVFDPLFLTRFQKIVGVVAELGLRNLDFGDLLEPPAGFDHAPYERAYGCSPTVANYLFYPQPPSCITTTAISGAGVEVEGIEAGRAPAPA